MNEKKLPKLGEKWKLQIVAHVDVRRGFDELDTTPAYTEAEMVVIQEVPLLFADEYTGDVLWGKGENIFPIEKIGGDA